MNASEFQQEMRTALSSGLGDDDVLAIVGRWRGEGCERADAYQSLEAIWAELGFEESSDPADAVQNQLEYVMERVWYAYDHIPVPQPHTESA